MRPSHKCVAVSCLLVVLAVFPRCSGKSAFEKTLEERARWTVLALDWAQAHDNAVLLSTRLNGPTHSALETLTVRIVLQDAAGEMILEVWHVFDLSEVPRGGPKDITVHIPSEVPVDGLALDRVLRPDEDDVPHIPELIGLD